MFQQPKAKTSRRWNPSAESCDDPSELNPIEKRIYDEIVKLRGKEKVDHTVNDQQIQAFLIIFQREISILSTHERQQIGILLVKYHKIFSRHRLDIGNNTEIKLKLTSEHDDVVYAQTLPTPTNLKDDLLVEMALKQKYGIFTTQPYNKHSSPYSLNASPIGTAHLGEPVPYQPSPEK